MTDPSSSSGPSPRPAWYADPADPTRQRWWDGQRWSDQVRLATVPQAPPTTVAAPPLMWPSTTVGRPGAAALPGYAGSQVGAPATTADGVRLGSFGRRLLSAVVDYLVVSFGVALVVPFFVTDYQNRLYAGMQTLYDILLSGTGDVPADLSHLLTITSYAVMATTFAYGVVTLSVWSRTLGQRLAGVAVCPVDKGTQKATWAYAIPRSVAWSLLSQSGGLFLLLQALSISMVLWHPKRQTIPDLLARTQVVRR